MSDTKIETMNSRDNSGKSNFKIGDTVQQKFSHKIMKITGFDSELIENVITEWEDDLGNTVLGKFIESELKLVKN